MPCNERVTIINVELPKNINRKHLVTGLSLLKFELTTNVYGDQTIMKDGVRIGTLTKDSQVEVETADMSKKIKQAFSVGVNAVEAKKRGLEIQKIKVKKNKVYMTLGTKGTGTAGAGGGAW